MSDKKHKIIDGDGHVVEDHSAIVAHMPEMYRDRFGHEPRCLSTQRPSAFCERALSSAGRLRQGRTPRVGSILWRTSASPSAVLYPTNGLSFGRIVSLDWAIELARAYNNWMHAEYLSKSGRFQALGLIPLQEPQEAGDRAPAHRQRNSGFCGAMLPSTGVMGAQNHLGDEKILANLPGSQPPGVLHRAFTAACTIIWASTI
jgi:predicted TIM-barrel fold metal-dependent hydrolase